MVAGKTCAPREIEQKRPGADSGEGLRLTRQPQPKESRLRDVPGAVDEAVARCVAGLRILYPGVERLALVSPLQRLVIALDDRVAVARLRTALSLERRPVSGARSVAGGLAVGVLVESVERH